MNASLSVSAMRPLSVWLASIVLAVLTLTPLSPAQTAPSGNSHPQAQMLTDKGSSNPFGTAPALSTMSVDQKYAFAKEVDLTPLRDLAVYHSGRIKILDSLARETIADIVGRKDYYDIKPDSTLRLRYDALFTYLDLIIDPAYYNDKPLIAVTYLPLRTRLIDAAFPGESKADVRETWNRLGRLTPAMMGGLLAKVTSTMQPDQPTQRGIDQIQQAMDLYLSSAGNLAMVASTESDKPWDSLTQLPAGSPGAKAVAALGIAWRKGDAAGVNQAAKDLAAVLPTINAETYPTTRRAVERWYNASNPFEWGMWFYAFALVSLLLAFGTHRATLKWMGLAFLLAGVLAHAGGFAARCYIAERFAIQNQFESMTGVSLFAAIIGLALAVFKRQWLFGAAVAAVGFMILITATQTGIPGKDINREAAILNTSVLLKYHVTTVLFSYGLISLGMVVSVFYLAAHYLGRRSGGSGAVMLAAGALGTVDIEDAPAQPATGRAKLLADLDKAQMTILQLAFWTLGVGILLGAWWADHSWGRWWAFDPKELWALVTWIVYLIVVHVRVGGLKDKGLTTAWLSLVGFIVMLWCYFGVNLLLPGLHAYA